MWTHRHTHTHTQREREREREREAGTRRGVRLWPPHPHATSERVALCTCVSHVCVLVCFNRSHCIQTGDAPASPCELCMCACGCVCVCHPAVPRPHTRCVPCGAQVHVHICVFILVRLSVCVTLQCLGLLLGVFHVELKYTSRGPRLIEVNCRMGGGPVRYVCGHTNTYTHTHTHTCL